MLCATLWACVAAFALCACECASPYPAGAAWARHRRDNRAVGSLSDGSGQTTPWPTSVYSSGVGYSSFNAGAAGAAVSSDGGTAYMRDSEGQMYAVSAFGERVWRVYAGRYGMDAGAALDAEGNVHMSCGLQLCRLRASDGAVMWETRTEGTSEPASSPVINGDVVYHTADGIYAGTNGLFAYEVSTGTKIWGYTPSDASGFAWGQLCLGPDGAILVPWSRTVHAVNPDGTRKWVFSGPTDVIFSAPAVAPDGTRAYVGSFDGSVYAITYATGALAWSTATGGEVRSSPVVDPDDGTVFYTTRPGLLLALDPATGEVEWSYNAGREVLGSPAMRSDKSVWFATKSGTLHGVRRDGSLMRTIDLGGAESRGALVATAKDGIIVGVDGGFMLRIAVGALVHVAQTTFTGSEATGTAVLELRRHGYDTATAFRATVAFSGQTATAGVDFDDTPLVATFPSGATSATVAVAIMRDDNTSEGPETFLAGIVAVAVDTGDPVQILTGLSLTTVTITDGPPPPPSSDATLAALAVEPAGYELDPPFDPAVVSYRIAGKVPFGVELRLRPAASDEAHASITVDGAAVVSGSLSPPLRDGVSGESTHVVACTAEDGDTVLPYSIIVAREEDGDASLVALELSGVVLRPPFSPAVRSYEADVPFATSSTRATVTAGSADASVAVNGAAVAAGGVSDPVALAAGVATSVCVVVTAENGTASDPYVVRVTRNGCGNGVVDPGEQCDDGNDQVGDGCSPECTREAGFDCSPGAPKCVRSEPPALSALPARIVSHAARSVTVFGSPFDADPTANHTNTVSIVAETARGNETLASAELTAWTNTHVVVSWPAGSLPAAEGRLLAVAASFWSPASDAVVIATLVTAPAITEALPPPGAAGRASVVSFAVAIPVRSTDPPGRTSPVALRIAGVAGAASALGGPDALVAEIGKHPDRVVRLDSGAVTGRVFARVARDTVTMDVVVRIGGLAVPPDAGPGHTPVRAASRLFGGGDDGKFSTVVAHVIDAGRPAALVAAVTREATLDAALRSAICGTCSSMETISVLRVAQLAATGGRHRHIALAVGPPDMSPAGVAAEVESAFRRAFLAGNSTALPAPLSLAVAAVPMVGTGANATLRRSPCAAHGDENPVPRHFTMGPGGHPILPGVPIPHAGRRTRRSQDHDRHVDHAHGGRASVRSGGQPDRIEGEDGALAVALWSANETWPGNAQAPAHAWSDSEWGAAMAAVDTGAACSSTCTDGVCVGSTCVPPGGGGDGSGGDGGEGSSQGGGGTGSGDGDGDGGSPPASDGPPSPLPAIHDGSRAGDAVSPQHSASSTPLLVGAAVGGAVGLAFLVPIAFLIWRRKAATERLRKRPRPVNPDTEFDGLSADEPHDAVVEVDVAEPEPESAPPGPPVPA